MSDPRDNIVASQEIAALVERTTDAWRRAKGEFGEDDEIAAKLDEVTGLLDDVWQMLLDMERERM